MEEKYRALCVRSVNYRDADKMLTLFTLEAGAVDCALRGARRPKAKRRFAGEPFCFAEYVLAEKQGRRTVVEADEIDGFYGLRTDIERYYAATVVIDFIRSFAVENSPDYPLFTTAITALKGIETGDPIIAVEWFLIKALDSAGYGMTVGERCDCGEKIEGRAFFDFSSSECLCSDCASAGATEIRFTTYSLLTAINRLSAEELSLLPDMRDGVKEGFDGAFADVKARRSVLKLLDYYVEEKTEYPLKTIRELIEMI